MEICYAQNGDKVSYGYDTVGRASSVSYQPSGSQTTSAVVDSVAYYPFGPVNLITFHNGRKLSKFYDLDYAIDKVISTAADGLLIDATPDVLGNLKTASSAVGASPPTRSFQYDPLYRLTGVTDASSASLESYSYNRTGDRLSKTRQARCHSRCRRRSARGDQGALPFGCRKG